MEDWGAAVEAAAKAVAAKNCLLPVHIGCSAEASWKAYKELIWQMQESVLSPRRMAHGRMPALAFTLKLRAKEKKRPHRTRGPSSLLAGLARWKV